MAKGKRRKAPGAPKNGVALTGIDRVVVDNAGTSIMLTLEGRPFAVVFGLDGFFHLRPLDDQSAPVVSWPLDEFAKIYAQQSGRRILPVTGPGIAQA